MTVGVHCEWCGRKFAVAVGQTGRPRKYCPPPEDGVSCAQASKSFAVVDRWVSQLLSGDLAGWRRLAAKAVREHIMSLRNRLRDPKTGRVL